MNPLRLLSVPLTVTLLVTGCTTTGAYMDSWIGNPIDDLTAVKGAPSSIIGRLDGGATATWSIFHAGKVCRQSFTTDSEGSIVSKSWSGCPPFSKATKGS